MVAETLLRIHRGAASATSSKDSPPLSAKGWGLAELEPLLPQVLARPSHFRLREGKKGGDGNPGTKQATRAAAAFTFVRPRGGTRGPHRLFQCTQSRWVPRAPAAAAATPEPAAAKRGSGSAQLLIIPEESS